MSGSSGVTWTGDVWVSSCTLCDDHTAFNSLLSVIYMEKLKKDTDVVHTDSDFRSYIKSLFCLTFAV